MINPKNYVDLHGRIYSLDSLSKEEQELVGRCIDYANEHPDWPEYGNWWLPEVAAFYAPRGLSRREIINTTVYRIAQDLDGRQMVAKGLARPPDYRDEIDELIRERFRTRREFCEATGLSEDMLSHVLAKRKHLAVDTLAEALGRIGYGLHIAPIVVSSPNVPSA